MTTSPTCAPEATVSPVTFVPLVGVPEESETQVNVWLGDGLDWLAWVS